MTNAYDVLFKGIAGIGDSSARAAFVIDKDGVIQYAEQIRRGELHNPYAPECSTRVGGEPIDTDERCYVCTPPPPPVQRCPDHRDQAVREGSHCPECGWEIGDPPLAAQGVHVPEEEMAHFAEGFDLETLDGIDAHQAASLGHIEPRTGHTVDLEHVEPTKQRDGDQVLPSGEIGVVVQDHIIDQEKNGNGLLGKPGMDLVVEAMEESKKVGIERYGAPLRTLNGRLTIKDAAEEARDLFVYLSSLEATVLSDKSMLIAAGIEALSGDSWYKAHPDKEWDEATTEEVVTAVVERILDWVLTKGLEIQEGQD